MLTISTNVNHQRYYHYDGDLTVMRIEALRSMYLKTMNRVHYLLKHYSAKDIIAPDIELLQKLSEEINKRESTTACAFCRHDDNRCHIGGSCRRTTTAHILSSNIKMIISTYHHHPTSR